MPVARRFGLTRVADITGLDRIGIPTYSAIVPDSDDVLSVYNGKGAARPDAIAGALMEAIERQAALRARPPLRWATAAELGERAIPPQAIPMRVDGTPDGDTRYAWVEGFDARTGAPVYIPAGFAGYLWPGEEWMAPFSASTSQGLAAGNCIEEAIAQAICEWIERDAWTLAELRSHWWPRARIERFTGRDPKDEFTDDLEAYPCLDLSGIGEPLEELMGKFRRAGFTPIVRDITSDLGVPVVVATIAEDEMPGFPQAHSGVGCHLDVRAAIARALTEAAQSRAVDIQAMREDIAPAVGDGHAQGIVIHTRRVSRIDRRRWLLAPSRSRRRWQDCPSAATTDVRADLELLFEAVGRAGITQIGVVDFSPAPEVAVVRVAIPGLEAWAADHGRFGERAASFWRKLEGGNA
jgi:ribosomal protein S12 methylthiotransferase accessory factor